MLIQNDRHKRFHEVGPKDVHWGKPKTAVCSIRITRSTISDEQMEVIVPVFSDDSRESLDLRLGMLMSLAQDRREDAALAWNESEENQERLTEQIKVKEGLLTHEEKQKLVDAKKK